MCPAHGCCQKQLRSQSDLNLWAQFIIWNFLSAAQLGTCHFAVHFSFKIDTVEVIYIATISMEIRPLKQNPGYQKTLFKARGKSEFGHGCFAYGQGQVKIWPWMPLLLPGVGQNLAMDTSLAVRSRSELCHGCFACCPQQVRARPWMLRLLPGVGQTLAMDTSPAVRGRSEFGHGCFAYCQEIYDYTISAFAVRSTSFSPQPPSNIKWHVSRTVIRPFACDLRTIREWYDLGQEMVQAPSNDSFTVRVSTQPPQNPNFVLYLIFPPSDSSPKQHQQSAVTVVV